MSSMEHVFKPWKGSIEDALDPGGTYSRGGKEHGVFKTPETPDAPPPPETAAEKRKKRIKKQLGDKVEGILQTEGEETYG